MVRIHPAVNKKNRERSRTPKDTFYKHPYTNASRISSISKVNITSSQNYSTSSMRQITLIWWSNDIDTVAQEFLFGLVEVKEGSRGWLYC